MKLTIIAFLFTLFSINNSNAKVLIKIKIYGSSANELKLILPWKQYLESSYELNTKKIIFKDSTEFELSIDNTTFVIFVMNNEMGFNLVIAPNDSILVTLNRTIKNSYPNYIFDFSGSNCNLHKLYNVNYYPAGKYIIDFENIPNQYNNYTDYYLKCTSKIDSILDVWKSISNIGIDSNVKYLYYKDIKGELYYKIIRGLGRVKLSQKQLENSCDYYKIKQIIYQDALAWDNDYLKTDYGINIFNDYLDNLVKIDPKITDTLLKKIGFRYYFLYPKEDRETLWGNALLYIVKKYTTSLNKADSLEIRTFQNYYPESNYLKLIQKYKDSLIEERIKKINGRILIDTSNYSSLKLLLAKVDARWVFIDVWATWCGPCVQEFIYYNDIAEFFKSKNIAQLFLSINNKEEQNDWIFYINKNKIFGNHFLINNQIQKEILQIIITEQNHNKPLSVPQYIIYDKLTHSFKANLPRPSSGTILKNMINDFVK